MRALQIEFIKLLRPSTFVLSGIMLVLFLLIAGIQYKISSGNNVNDSRAVSSSTANADAAKTNIEVDMVAVMKAIDSSQMGIVYTIFSIFIMMNIGKEYSENTLRRSVIEGYTRDQFFAGKLLLLLFTAVFVLLLQKIFLLASAAVAGHYKESLDYINAQVMMEGFLKTMFYGVFGLFLVFITRSITISVVIYFVWETIETGPLALLKFKYPDMDWVYYLPLSGLKNTLAGTEYIALQLLLIPVAYQLVMLLSSYFLLLKRDIK